MDPIRILHVNVNKRLMNNIDPSWSDEIDFNNPYNQSYEDAISMNNPWGWTQTRNPVCPQWIFLIQANNPIGFNERLEFLL